MHHPPHGYHEVATYSIGDRIEGRWLVEAVHGGTAGAEPSGMGIVYVVRDVLSGHVSAVKTLQPRFMHDLTRRESLKREAELWMSLGRHPNIVPVESLFARETWVFVFMEYIRPDAGGRNHLGGFLGGSPLGEDLAIAWATDICSGMAHAQARGLICHRDLKPANLMISADRVLRVTDFGIARRRVFSGGTTSFLASHPTPASTTWVSGFTGTPGYMAPELLEREEASIRSDLYSFGLIFCQMLLGLPEPPFAAEWTGDVVQYELANLAIRRARGPIRISRRLDGFLDRCLAQDPQQRPGSFDEAAAELDHLTGGAVTARRKTVGAPEIATAVVMRSAEDHIERSISFQKLRRPGEALHAILAARALSGPSAVILNNEGAIRTDLKQYDEALACLDEAIRMRPDWIMPWSNKGRCLLQMGRPADAIPCYRRAIEIDQRHTPPWISLGNSYAALDRHAEALAAYERAIAIDSHDWSAWRGRALSCENLDRLLEARVSAERALQLAPRLEEAEAIIRRVTKRLQAQATPLPPPEAI
jgi:tetratricopeptide (TPR) repeat protein